MCVHVLVQEGRTAVMYGVMGKSVEVTKFLTVSGADLTITDNVRALHSPHTVFILFCYDPCIS